MSNENVKGEKIRKGPLISLSFLALLIGLWWGVPTYRKERADALVRDLCTKDGGIKVYETMPLPKEKFSRHGNPIFPGNKTLPPLQMDATSSDEFYFTAETTWIVPDRGIGSLAVWRSHQKLFHAVDHKLLGEAVSYSRRGSDPIGPWHPSSFGCPSNADITHLIKKVLVKK